MNDYSRIPAELRSLKQWVLFDKDKVPYQINGTKANVTDPDTWTSFDSASRSLDGYNGLGFVFSIGDNYSGIDLDYGGNADQQLAIFNSFDSYSEISPSGKGLHIIVKGTVPVGRRKNKIEVYSSNRYFTMTGNVYNDKPIRECQILLTQLWEQMGSTLVVPTQIPPIGDTDEKYTDTEIIEQAKLATNGEKFVDFFEGNWNNNYPSQSEADYAFIDIISFYTKNKDQIKRIFHRSALGKRQKAKRQDYVNGMINKSFDQTPPPIDFTGFKEALEKKIGTIQRSDNDDTKISGITSSIKTHNDVRFELNQSNQSSSNSTTNQIGLPPGLIGQIACYIYAAAPKPIIEVAIAGAIGLMAGICGRAYNVSGTGLNQYVLFLARTAMGKEAMNHGINRLIDAVKMTVPCADEFVGPGDIASGPALTRYLNDHGKCFVSFFDEFGHRLQVMSSQKAQQSDITFKRKLLDLYNNSGRSDSIKPSAYADADNNIATILCPAVSLLACSTPEKVYEELTEEMITEGLLPRFTIIEYKGDRPETNYKSGDAIPGAQLTTQLADLCAHCLKMMYGVPGQQKQQWVDVQFNEQAMALYQSFDKHCNLMYNTHRNIMGSLWGRAQMKVQKLAALIAVGCNYINPIITTEHIYYATSLIEHEINALSFKFETGETGKYTEHGQIQNVIKVIISHQDWSYAIKYGTKKHIHDAGIIPYTYISRRLMDTASFRSDPKGATFAIKRSLQSLIDSGKLRELTKEQLKPFNTTQRCFVVSDASILDEYRAPIAK